MPGPPPKRSEQRRGRNKLAGPDLIKAPAGQNVTWQVPDPTWDPIAERWYRSLAVSGQAQFYEQSDADHAYFVADAMNRTLKGRFSGQAFAAINTAMSELLSSEGSRRKARIELQRGGGQLAEVRQLKNYRSAAAE